MRSTTGEGILLIGSVVARWLISYEINTGGIEVSD